MTQSHNSITLLSPQQAYAVSVYVEHGYAGYVQLNITLKEVYPESRLRERLQTLSARYENLCSKIIFVSEGEARQAIFKESSTAFSALPISEYSKLHEAAKSQLHKTYLEHALYIHACEDIILLTMPGWGGDAHSLQLIAQALFAADIIAADDIIQYPDLATLLQESLCDESATTQRDYWRSLMVQTSCLSGLQSHHPDLKQLTASPDLCSKVQENRLLRLLTAWALLMAKRSNLDQILIGYYIDGRHFEQLQTVIGPLAKQIPLSISVNAPCTFSELVEVLQAKIEQAKDSVDYFDWSLQDKAIYRFFKFGFNTISNAFLQSKLLDNSFYNEISINVVEEPLETSLLEAMISYEKKRYSAEDIHVIQAQLQYLCTQIAQNPSIKVANLSWLPTDHHMQLKFWSCAQRSTLRYKTFIHAFHAQVLRNGDNLALHYECMQLSYAELSKKSNQLAHLLLQEGHGRGDRIGICLSRTPELIISVLACIKAGCSYVPLDPQYPQARLNRIIESAQPTAIIVTSIYLDKVSDSTVELSIIDWEQDKSDIESQNEDNPDTDALPQDEVYLIYTSGSTGEPKGVVVSHAALQNYIESIEARLCLPERASLAALASVSTDLSYTALYGALGTGRCLRLLHEEKNLDAPALAIALQKDPLDCLKIVPTHLKALLSGDNPHNVLPLQCLVLGGEAPESELIERLRRLAPHMRIINHYGPTETTVGICSHTLSTAIADTATVGHPLINNRCYVLDKKLDFSGIGIQGDLYLAGNQLSNGYDRRPTDTANVFVPDPHSDQPGARMYRSGDRAYYDSEGRLVFCGRKDKQVKLRGHRIELTEIEHAIKNSFQVQDVIAEIKKIQNEPRILVYWIDTENNFSQEAFQACCQRVLPEYMQPHYWIKLKQLPLMTNGKLDRNNLPLPASNVISASVPPQTPTETVLQRLFSELLGIKEVSTQDNFFSLGGDSIIAIQLVARARQQGYAIKPRQVFDHPNISALASVIEKVQPINAREQSLVIGKSSLSPIQARFFKVITQDRHQYNQAVLYDLQDKIDEGVLRECIKILFQQHDALRSTFHQDINNHWHQEYIDYSQRLLDLSYAKIVLEDTDHKPYLSSLEEMIIAQQAQFKLEHAPLIRFIYMPACGVHAGKILIIAHHLIIDAVSWSILENDLKRFYESASKNITITPADKTGSYLDWIKRINDHLHGEFWKADRIYWAKMLKNVQTLPLQSADTNNTCDASSKRFYLDAEITKALNGKANDAYHTRSIDILLTALALAFKNWTRNNILSLMLEANGRDITYLEHDSSRTVGWFTCIYPVNITLDAQASTLENLRYVKEQLRSVPESGLSYAAINYTNRTENSNPSIKESQLCFNYFGRFFAQNETQAFIKLSDKSELAQLATRSNHQSRAFALEIMAMQTANGLIFNFIYNEKLISEATIDRLLQDYAYNIRELVSCCGNAAPAYTPSDFPDINLQQPDLDRIFKTLSKPNNIQSIYPATQVQSGILFHSMAMPETGVYVPQHAIDIELPLNVAIFKQAWQLIIERHAPFRTAFIQQDNDTPLQLVHHTADLPFLELDWSVDQSNHEAKFKILLQQQWLASFDFEKSPLMRLCLIKFPENHYRFIWTYHHVIIDGWSGPIILREFFTLYEALLNEKPVHLPTPQPYINYIRWLRKQDHQVALSFWKQQLHNFEHDRRITDVFMVSEVREQAAGKYEITTLLPIEDSRILQALAQKQNITLSVLCQAAWALLLYRYTRCVDVIFGVTVSGRPAELEGVESMVGQLINTLPFRVKIDLLQPLSLYLQSLQNQYVNCNEYAYIPLSEIQTHMETRHASGLFDTLVVFENYPVGNHEDHQVGDQFCRHIYSVSQNNYPLSLVVVPGEKISITLKYAPRNFTEHQVEKILEVYLEITQQFSALLNANPMARLADIQFVQAAERYQLQQWFMGGAQHYTHPDFISGFYAGAAQHPRATALAYIDENNITLDYHTLNQLSNQFGRYLQDERLPAQAKIGICLPRSIEQVTSILACLKAGFSYVPMDPRYPQARLSRIIEHARLHAIITNSECLDKVSDSEAEVRLIDWRQDQKEIQQYPEHNLEITIHPEQTAYTIYTSGTTGEPKGVSVPHRALQNYICSINARLKLTRTAEITALATTAADLGYTALYGALGTGRCLRLISEDKSLDAEALAREGEIRAIDCLKIVPSHLSALLNIDTAERLLPRECLILGGEAASPELIKRIKHLSPDLLIVNHYGPTETTVGISTHTFIDLHDRVQTIGRPLNNCQCYVLDRMLAPTGIGVEGDLYLAGENLALGYAGRAADTAAMFVPNPYSETAGSRMYRSGDRAKYNEKGQLIFCGRQDQQKKIRGYRIELGEIENCLKIFPGIHDAVVQLQEINQRPQLIAYLVGNSETEKTLQDHLREQLPDYMQPHFFLWLPQLPLTANGKLDRQALPAPMQKEGIGRLLNSSIEHRLANIWQEFLHIEMPRSDDNFFDLGGDSLILMRVHRRIADEIDASLKITDLFKYTTIAKLAEYIEQADSNSIVVQERQARVSLKKEAMAANKARALKRKDKQKA